MVYVIMVLARDRPAEVTCVFPAAFVRCTYVLSNVYVCDIPRPLAWLGVRWKASRDSGNLVVPFVRVAS